MLKAHFRPLLAPKHGRARTIFENRRRAAPDDAKVLSLRETKLITVRVLYYVHPATTIFLPSRELRGSLFRAGSQMCVLSASFFRFTLFFFLFWAQPTEAS